MMLLKAHQKHQVLILSGNLVAMNVSISLFVDARTTAH